MPATEEALIHARVAALAALEKLGSDVIAIDVSDHLAITDLFVVVTGKNEPQVNAIVDEVEKKLLEVGEKPLRREGAREGRWVLLDYGDIIARLNSRTGFELTSPHFRSLAPFIPVSRILLLGN